MDKNLNYYIILSLFIFAVLIVFYFTRIIFFFKRRKKINRITLKTIRNKIKKQKLRKRKVDLYIYFGNIYDAKNFLNIKNENDLFEIDDTFLVFFRDNRISILLYDAFNFTKANKQLKDFLKLIGFKLNYIFLAITADKDIFLELKETLPKILFTYNFKMKEILILFDLKSNNLEINNIIKEYNMIRMDKQNPNLNMAFAFLDKSFLKSGHYDYILLEKLYNLSSYYTSILRQITDRNIYILLNHEYIGKKIYLEKSGKNNFLIFKKNNYQFIILGLVSVFFSIVFSINLVRIIIYNKNQALYSLSSKTLSFVEEQQNIKLILPLLYPFDKILINSEILFYKYRLPELILSTIKKSSSVSEINILILYSFLLDPKINQKFSEDIKDKIVSMSSIILKIKKEILEKIIFTNVINYYNLFVEEVNIIKENQNKLFYLDQNSTKYLLSVDSLIYALDNNDDSLKPTIDKWNNNLYFCFNMEINKQIIESKVNLPKEVPDVLNDFINISIKNFKHNLDNSNCNIKKMNAYVKMANAIDEILDNQNSLAKYDSFGTLLNSIKSNINVVYQELDRLDFKSIFTNDEYSKIVSSINKYIIRFMIKNVPIDLPLISEKSNFVTKINILNSKSINIESQYTKEFIEKYVLNIYNNYQSFKMQKYLTKGSNLDSIFEMSKLNYAIKYINYYQKIFKEIESFDYVSDQSHLLSLISSLLDENSEFNIFLNNFKKNVSSLPEEIFNKEQQTFFSDEVIFLKEEYSVIVKKIAGLKIRFSIFQQNLNQIILPVSSLVRELHKNVLKSQSEDISPSNMFGSLQKLWLDLQQDLIVKLNDQTIKKMGNISAVLQIFNSFPFEITNKNADVLSNKFINKTLINSSTIYSNLVGIISVYETLLKNKYISPKSIPEKIKQYLFYYKKIQYLNKLLFDDNQKPKDIVFNLTTAQINNSEIKYFGVFMDGKDVINSLNMGHSITKNISLDWIHNRSFKFVVKLNNDEIIEKTYDGEWAIIKALQDSELIADDVYEWKLKYHDHYLKVNLKVISDFFKITKDTSK